jgi:hypothetical protein
MVSLLSIGQQHIARRHATRLVAARYPLLLRRRNRLLCHRSILLRGSGFLCRSRCHVLGVCAFSLPAHTTHTRGTNVTGRQKPQQEAKQTQKRGKPGALDRHFREARQVWLLSLLVMRLQQSPALVVLLLLGLRRLLAFLVCVVLPGVTVVVTVVVTMVRRARRR